jgi:hypothetical protein
MTTTPDQLNGTARIVKNDWKSLVSLLLTALIFVGGVTWMVTGYIVRGAASEIKSHTEKINSIESRQSIIENQFMLIAKRQDEVFSEIKADMKTMSTKLNSVAESQARVEGVIVGSKK